MVHGHTSVVGDVQQALLERAPESVVSPTLERIKDLTRLMGDPQLATPVIHIAGTNGKTSTARMIDALLRAFGIRTGLFTSPHLSDLTERIQIAGEPVAPEALARAYDDVAPYLGQADARGLERDRFGGRLSMFEVLTAMSFSAFADAPVDVAIIECGMGGRWDATNVVVPAVSVITPIGVDHVEYLGESLAEIAAEKAGILRRGMPAVLAHQTHEVAAVLNAACAELNIHPVREGLEFGVADRVLAVGGQQLAIDGLAGRYDDLFVPLHGIHQAQNAAVAVASVESFLGGGTRPLSVEKIREGLATVTAPGRIEPLRSGPAVIVDAAHNPHGATALARALAESFDFGRVVGIFAVLEGKDARAILEAVEPVMDELIVTENSSPRSALADDVQEIARSVFGDDRVTLAPGIPMAVDDALARADELMEFGSVGVVAFGSVATAADVREYIGAVAADR